MLRCALASECGLRVEDGSPITIRPCYRYADRRRRLVAVQRRGAAVRHVREEDGERFRARHHACIRRDHRPTPPADRPDDEARREGETQWPRHWGGRNPTVVLTGTGGARCPRSGARCSRSPAMNDQYLALSGTDAVRVGRILRWLPLPY